MSETPCYLVIGAAGGIGTALCRRLVRRGPCRLVLAGRSADKLRALADDLRGAAAADAPVATLCQPLDARNGTEVEDAFAAAQREFGAVHGVVNLCGSILLKPAHLTSDAEFQETLAVNLVTAFNVVRAAAKAMTAGGSVVLLSTVAARIGLANHEAIAAAKAGVNGLVIAAAATYAARNLRINAVAPGLVRTPLAAKITGNELALKASTALHPLGRIGEPDDVAAAIAWLLDPATTWVTGQVIGVDGGLSTVRSK